jgi:hypothetical protein
MPLVNEPVHRALPVFCFCLKPRSKKDKDTPSWAKMFIDKLISKSIQAELKDPFLKLGSGMFAYRQFIRTLCVLFFVLSILSSPIIYIYRTSSGYQENTQGWEKYSLGNMGYS